MASTSSKKEIKFITAPAPTKSVEDAKKIIQDGSELIKVKSASNLYSRKFFYNSETESITYEGSKKIIEPPEIIKLQDIHDVRKGWRTDTFNKISQQMEKDKDKKLELKENCCFSIVYGPDHRSLDLMCPSEKICNQWVVGLNHFIAVAKSRQRNELYQNVFNKADATKSGNLTLDEVMTMLDNLHIDMNKKQVKDLFQKCATSKKNRKGVSVINKDEFATFYAMLKERPELNELFYRYTKGEDLLNPSQLLNFIKVEQKLINMNEKTALLFINSHEPTDSKALSCMSLEGFQNFLLSEDMDIFNKNHRKVFQDMDQPLSFYYIASSHNTYLMADQLAGESSIEGYIRALKMGCRCVEYLWDGEDTEPIIYHGYTLTSKILLKDVLISAIKTYSFATSEYPVILSLENHLSINQQKILANHLKTILGDLLYTQSVSELSNLPSPNKLKKKIIIKNKKLSRKQKEDETVSADSEDDDEGRPVEIDSESKRKLSSSKSEKKSWMPWKKGRKKEPRVKLAQELSDLVNICTAVHFQGFDNAKKSGKWWEMSSLSEAKAFELAETQIENFVNYNRNQLIRIYPSGKRQDSSNYDPLPLWNVGCHMVALNYQNPDKYMMYNTAKFLTNGQCGYVLKPSFLIKGLYDDGMIKSGVMTRLMLTIKIISGQHLPRTDYDSKGDFIDPYVIVKVRGFSDDVKTFKTKVVQNNGFNPVWNEVFTFLIKVPHLAFVHFIVRDYNAGGRSDKLGEYCIHFESIEQGYRHVHLVDKNNRSIVPASIFVHVLIS